MLLPFCAWRSVTTRARPACVAQECSVMSRPFLLCAGEEWTHNGCTTSSLNSSTPPTPCVSPLHKYWVTIHFLHTNTDKQSDKGCLSGQFVSLHMFTITLHLTNVTSNSVLLYVHRDHKDRLSGIGSPGWPPQRSPSSWALTTSIQQTAFYWGEGGGGGGGHGLGCNLGTSVSRLGLMAQLYN